MEEKWSSSDDIFWTFLLTILVTVGVLLSEPDAEIEDSTIFSLLGYYLLIFLVFFAVSINYRVDEVQKRRKIRREGVDEIMTRLQAEVEVERKKQPHRDHSTKIEEKRVSRPAKKKGEERDLAFGSQL